MEGRERIRGMGKFSHHHHHITEERIPVSVLLLLLLLLLKIIVDAPLCRRVNDESQKISDRGIIVEDIRQGDNC